MCQGRRHDDTINWVAVHVLEFHGPHCDFGRQTDLTDTQRQKATAPVTQVRRASDALAAQRPSQLETDDRRNGEFTRDERGVAASPCRLSEPWHLLGHPQDGVRIEQEGHRTVL